MNAIYRFVTLVLVGSLVLSAGVGVAAGSSAGTGVPARDGVGPAQTADESTNETAPRLDLALDGDHVGPGDYELVESDPELSIEASVGPDADPGTTLENVIVRVGGTTERSYSPEGEEASVSLTLPLDRGNNTVRVLVEDSEDRLTSEEFTVGKDDIAPWIGLTSPYESDLRAVIPDGEAVGTVVDVGVRIGEFSTVRRAKIQVNYNGTSDGVLLREPGKRFNREFLFGYGNNSVRITATDAVGNTRIQEFTVKVVDDEPPEIDLDLYPDKTTDASVDLTGTISDDVWVRNASVHVEHLDGNNVTGAMNRSEEIRAPTDYRYDQSGTSVDFEQDVSLRYGTNEIRITAGDHLNNVTTRTIEIERIQSSARSQNEPPTVTIDEGRTTLGDDGQLQLHAQVTDPDWDLAAVSLETANASTGDVIDFERFSGLSGSHSLTLNETLNADTGQVRLRVRAFDEQDNRDVQTVWLSPGDGETAAATTPADESNETETLDNETETNDAEANATTTEQTSQPEPTTAATVTSVAGNATGNETGNATGNATDSGGLPLIGSLPFGKVIGLLTTAAPFVVGGLVFVTMAYFVLRRVQGGDGESAS